MNVLRESRTGAARAASAEPAGAAPASVSDVRIASQKRCGSSSPGSSETHATRWSLPRPSTDDSSAVLPLPAGPHTSVTGS